MLKNTSSPQCELEMISLEQLVPKKHLVRKVAKAIDFEFIRDEVTHLIVSITVVQPLTLFGCSKSCHLLIYSVSKVNSS